MAALSGIEWTDATWNPLTGCDKVTPGCKNWASAAIGMIFANVSHSSLPEGFERTVDKAAA